MCHFSRAICCDNLFWGHINWEMCVLKLFQGIVEIKIIMSDVKNAYPGVNITESNINFAVPTSV